MNILITGASGFIGSHLSKRLEKEGHNLILVDDFSRGKQTYLDYLGVKTLCVESDLRKINSCLRFIPENLDILYHCASRIGGMQFLHGTPEKELSALQENLAIDNNVFRACVKKKVKKVVYTSSVSVYNTNDQYLRRTNFSESDTLFKSIDPEGGYGWAKFIGEKNLKAMSNVGIKTGIARIFKSYGPCDDYSEESGQVVCSLMRKVLKNEPFVVWGNGLVERCLVYIDDLVDALILLSKAISERSMTVNVGGNESISMMKLAEEIKEISKTHKRIILDKRKPSGPSNRIPNLSFAKNVLHWEPTTPLHEGLTKTWNWMKEDVIENKR